MSDRPWLKFYPRDWRGDQALRAVSLTARGLWMEMLCVMHEASPYGHLLIGGQPVSDAVLARLVGATVEEIQALLVELRDARVFRQTRGGVIYSKRMTDDHKRSVAGRNAKNSALSEVIENERENRRPSRVSERPPRTHIPEARSTDVLLFPETGEKAETQQRRVASPTGKGSRLDPGWEPSREHRAYAASEGFGEAAIDRMAENFRDFWIAKPGKDGVKLDWGATWRRWVRTTAERTPPRSAERPKQVDWC